MRFVQCQKNVEGLKERELIKLFLEASVGFKLGPLHTVIVANSLKLKMSCVFFTMCSVHAQPSVKFTNHRMNNTLLHVFSLPTILPVRNRSLPVRFVSSLPVP